MRLCRALVETCANLNKNNGWQIVKNSAIIVFLNLNENILREFLSNNNKTSEEINLEINVLPLRNRLLKENADIVVEISSLKDNQIINEIIREIEKYYKVGE